MNIDSSSRYEYKCDWMRGRIRTVFWAGQIEGRECQRRLMRIISNSAKNKLIGFGQSDLFLTKLKKEVINRDRQNKKVNDDFGVNIFTPEKKNPF